MSFRGQFHQRLKSSFRHADPESAKNTDNLTVFFALLELGHVKAAHKTLEKLTLGFTTVG